MYKCSKCNLEVIVSKTSGNIIRACECTIDNVEIELKKYFFGLITIKKKVIVKTPAPIIAEAKATMKGVGRVSV